MDKGIPPGKTGLAKVDARLRALHEISMELSRAPDLDALFKTAVVLSTSRLGFDRIGIWLLDPADPGWIVGTWGTDEAGRPRDENGIRFPVDSKDTPKELLDGLVPFVVIAGGEAYDERRNVVGRSDKLIAPLWDGSRILGEIVADNLFGSRSLGGEDGEILVLLARTVAHLSALKRSEAALQAALDAKALLLRELRHRTKNSFALISSLISIEARRSGDSVLVETLEKLGDRVSVLTSLYGRLDLTTGLGRIRLDEYLGKIAVDLLDGYGAAGRSIALSRSLESMEIDADRAVPLGLIVNELVTNSLKYAFPDGRKGYVDLKLGRGEDDGAVLSVSDDGAGLPEGFAGRLSTGLGFTLVDMLCAQIAAELSVGKGPGASFDIRFQL
jgi:two-component sensor histidine kinase